MYTRPGMSIGDLWPFCDEKGMIHLFCLTAPAGDPDPAWEISHLTGTDLVNWEYHGAVLSRGAAGSFDDAGLATGSVMKHEGRYYMAYTAHSTREKIKCGSIGLAVSDDLFHWEKAVDAPIATLDPVHYEDEITGSRPFLHWRDPFLFRHDGCFHLALCARRKNGPIKTRGAVAHLVSSDLHHWETLPPFQTEPLCEEMECPQLHRIHSRWFLLFSTHRDLIDPPVVEAEPGISGGVFVQTAPSLDAPFTRSGSGYIPVSMPECYFYAPQLLCLHGRYWLLGTRWMQECGSISDPVEILIDENRMIPLNNNEKGVPA